MTPQEAMQQQSMEQKLEAALTRIQQMEALLAPEAGPMLAPEDFWGTRPRRTIPDPLPYAHDGKMRYSTWRMKVQAVIRNEKEAFSSAEALLMWGFSCLVAKAADLVAPWVEERAARGGLRVEDIEEWLEHCDSLFNDGDHRRRMQEEFFGMRQGSRTFPEFFAEWSQTLVAAGLVLDGPTKERALLSALNPGFRARAAASLVTQKGFDAKVEYLKGLADVEDSFRVMGAAGPAAQIKPRQQQRSGGGLPPPQAAVAATAVTAAVTTADVMDWEPTPANAVRARWITAEERARRHEAGQCRRCGGADHFERECPALPARRPAGAASRVAASRVVVADPAGVEAVSSSIIELELEGKAGLRG